MTVILKENSGNFGFIQYSEINKGQEAFHMPYAHSSIWVLDSGKKVNVTLLQRQPKSNTLINVRDTSVTPQNDECKVDVKHLLDYRFSSNSNAMAYPSYDLNNQFFDMGINLNLTSNKISDEWKEFLSTYLTKYVNGTHNPTTFELSDMQEFIHQQPVKSTVNRSCLNISIMLIIGALMGSLGAYAAHQYSQ